MGVDEGEDLKRKPIELTLSAAAAAHNPKTGWIHPGAGEIPLLENCVWVLALFRSRLAENVLLGKDLLEKLLEFEVEGNFPVCLHEYPQCKDRDFSLELLPVFHWLLFSFRSALGDALSLRLECLVGRILSHAYKMHRQRPLCLASELRLKSWFEPHNIPSWTPESPEEWSSALISDQMAASLHPSYCSLLAAAAQQWHPQLAVYMGPQDQDHAEPKVTLYDLFMGHYFGLYSRRALQDHRTALLAALVHPFEEERVEIAHPPIPCRVDHPFSLYWGSPEKLHSFVLDAQRAFCTAGDNCILVHLPPSTIPEGQDAVELSFFCNLEASSGIRIGGVRATTFQLGDVIALNDSLRLQIALETGEGRFFGHILRANRPSQKGKNLKFETYDWQIALRTIRRSDDCVLRISII